MAADCRIISNVLWKRGFRRLRAFRFEVEQMRYAIRNVANNVTASVVNSPAATNLLLVAFVKRAKGPSRNNMIVEYIAG